MEEEAFSPSLQILHASKNGDHPLEKDGKYFHRLSLALIVQYCAL